MSKKLTDSIKAAVEPVVTSLGYELVDVEDATLYEQLNITVSVWNKEGITLEDCEKVHLAIDPILDELNPTSDLPYVLNVSSPGLDRHFKTQRDFERNYGIEVEVLLYAPIEKSKKHVGTLISADDKNVTIQKIDGTMVIDRKAISVVRQNLKF